MMWRGFLKQYGPEDAPISSVQIAAVILVLIGVFFFVFPTVNRLSLVYNGMCIDCGLGDLVAIFLGVTIFFLARGS
jgi:hypothetical protein